MCRILEVPTPNLGEGLADQENVVRKLDECRGVWLVYRRIHHKLVPASYKLKVEVKAICLYIYIICIYIYISTINPRLRA